MAVFARARKRAIFLHKNAQKQPKIDQKQAKNGEKSASTLYYSVNGSNSYIYDYE
jgi:hypothetical protein